MSESQSTLQRTESDRNDSERKINMSKRDPINQVHAKTIRIPLKSKGNSIVKPRPNLKVHEVSPGTDSSPRKSAWKVLFGSFLNNVQLRKRISVPKSTTQFSHDMNDPLLNEQPIDILPTGKALKPMFHKFLSGQITQEELLQAQNFPRTYNFKQPDSKLRGRLMGHRPKRKQLRPHPSEGETPEQFAQRSARRNAATMEDGSLGPFKNNEIQFFGERKSWAQDMVIDELEKAQHLRRLYIRGKFRKIKELINERIDIRKSISKKNRQENIKNVNFIRTFFGIGMDIKEETLHNEDLRIDKEMPVTRKFKTMRCNYDDVSSTLRKIKTSPKQILEDTQFSKSVMKKDITQDADRYLTEIQETQNIAYNNAIRQIRINIEGKNAKYLRRNHTIIKTEPSPDNDPLFKIYMKPSKQNKNRKEQLGILTLQDLKLYDYINNRPQEKSAQMKELSKKFQELTSPKEQDHTNKFKARHLQKLLTRTNTYIKPPVFDNNDTSISNDSSLQSIYEVNVDNLYHQMKDLKVKLQEKSEGFAKRLKQLMKMEDVKKECLKSNIQKLYKTSIYDQ